MRLHKTLGHTSWCWHLLLKASMVTLLNKIFFYEVAQARRAHVVVLALTFNDVWFSSPYMPRPGPQTQLGNCLSHMHSSTLVHALMKEVYDSNHLRLHSFHPHLTPHNAFRDHMSRLSHRKAQRLTQAPFSGSKKGPVSRMSCTGCSAHLPDPASLRYCSRLPLFLAAAGMALASWKHSSGWSYSGREHLAHMDTLLPHKSHVA
eukprot:scaffold59259_cov20-Tisochrysis_lutea.AAC.1